MIQDISPKIFNNEYKLTKPKKDDTIFVFNRRTILISVNDKEEYRTDFKLPTLGELDTVPADEDIVYIFSIDNKPYYLYWGEEVIEATGYSYEDVLYSRRASSEELGFCCMSAWHLNTWYRHNRFCGVCAHKRIPGTTERSLICTSCNDTTYPRIQPAVIIAVRNNNKLLKTRYAGRPYTGWALVAGFCEFGETIEDTVRREVLEEVGLQVKNITYYKSQPWGIEQDLLIGVYCDLEENSDIRLDVNELSEARWFDREEIPKEENLYSLTATMIEAFRTGKI